MRFAVVAVIGVALLLTGCASSSDSSPQASPSSASPGTATPIPNPLSFTSDGAGFSISWDDAKLSSSTYPRRPAAAEQSSLVELTLADRDDSDRPLPFKDPGGLHVVAQRMALPEQSRPPAEDNARRLLTDLAHRGALSPFPLVERWDGLQVSGFGPVELGGASGYRAIYTWPDGRAEYYLLFSGLDTYRITLSSTADSADSIWPTLYAALQSFTVAQ